MPAPASAVNIIHSVLALARIDNSAAKQSYRYDIGISRGENLVSKAENKHEANEEVPVFRAAYFRG